MLLRRILPIALLLGGVPAAKAEKVLLYGVERGCQVDQNMTKTVEQQLASSAYSVVRVTPAAPMSQPLAAAEQVTRACPGTSGRLLGGFIEESPGLKRVRLWLTDLDAKQVAVLDDYCSDCDLNQRVGLLAARLAEKGQLGGVPSPRPTYCQSDNAVAVGPSRSNKLAVVVYGEAKARGAVWSAVRTAVQGTGRDVAQTHSEAKSFGPSDLRKMLREPSGQVLGVELTPEGASVWVFDGQTERTQPKNVDCVGCDREELGRKVALTAQAVLDTCFDAQCADGAKGTLMRPPAEACVPFNEPKCAGGDFPSSGRRTASGTLDPQSARLIKGLTWGAFAASAATGITLLAISGTSAGNYDLPSGGTIGNHLDGPGWTMLGAAGVMLGIAIPITVVANRASSGFAQRAPAGSGLASVQCPN